jgi:hypothetical protein
MAKYQHLATRTPSLSLGAARAIETLTVIAAPAPRCTSVGVGDRHNLRD